jgi:glycosyltransferase involved in cell wall biosynthesis
MLQPDLSIVMGTYNRLELLQKVVQKVLSTPISIEMVINDAGSTDGTIEYLEKIQKTKNVVPIFSGKKTNITQAYNEGFKKATGKYITWLSDDTIPINNSISVMLNFMKTLGPNDMGGFSTQGDGAIRGFPSPLIGCVLNETMKKMNYWNTDFPYYGQDNEFDARILRLGGKIVNCPGAKIDHLDCRDGLKSGNVEAYRAQGHAQKFQIIYFRRYGIKSEYMYPVTAFIPVGNPTNSDITETLKSVHKHYKNMNFHLFYGTYSNSIAKGLDYVKIIKAVPRKQWNIFDLVVVIRPDRKILLTSEGKEITMEFGKKLLNS